MRNNNNKKVASSKQEETKTSAILVFLSVRDIHSEVVETLAFMQFILLSGLKLCRFGLSVVVQILPLAQEVVEFLISILSCIYKEGFFVPRKFFIPAFQ